MYELAFAGPDIASFEQILPKIYVLLRSLLIIFEALLIGCVDIIFKCWRQIWMCQHSLKNRAELILVVINLTGNRLYFFNEKPLKNVSQIFHFFV